MKIRLLRYVSLFICSVFIIFSIGNISEYTVAQTQPSQRARQVTAIAFSPDGNTLAAGISDSQIAMVNVETGNVSKTLAGHLGAEVSGVVFSPDGKILNTVGTDTTVRLWNVITGEQSQVLQAPEHPPRTIATSPDGKALFTSGEDSNIFRWDLTTNKLSHVFEGHKRFVNSLVISPDSKILASADEGGVVIMWNASTGEKLQTLVAHQDRVTGLAFSPDSTTLASVSSDRTSRLWDVANAKEIKVFRDATQPLQTVIFSRDGQSLIAGGDENTLFVWNAKSGGLRLRLNTVDAIKAVAVSPDGTSFASAGKEGNVGFWNLSSGLLQRTVKLNEILPIRSYQVSIDSSKRNKISKTPKKSLTSTAEATVNIPKATLLAAIPSPPGGPILVVTSTANPFSNYYAEILSNEGLNLFNVSDISSVSSATLANYDIVILSEMTLTSAQVTMFNNWVTGGGNLITMRPDRQLAGLLGLTDAASTLTNGYLLVNNSTSAGKGIVNQTIQFHGTADSYTLNGATSIATLYTNATTSTANPAVTLRSVGSGQAAAFTYDLARSIVLTRQGNPAWAGQERDGCTPIRSNDMFYGGSNSCGNNTSSTSDWVDLNKVAIPQADEQQRLLANLIVQMNLPKKPLPRFWYFPADQNGVIRKAVVLMSGDDHANGGTAGRFDQFKAASKPSCSLDNWECVRGTSYIYPNSPLTNAQANQYVNIDGGFEVSLHVNTNCADYTNSSLNTNYTEQLSSFTSKYSSIEAPKTERHHCLVWSDWFSTPQIELNNGIRLDTTYYYWPPSWVADRPGFFSGSGMPMRFVNQDGTIIDVFGAATQLTDESGQSYPYNIDTLLDRAIGAEGYYGVFNVNAHTDSVTSSVSDAVVTSAQNRGIPIVSARQVLTWLDSRNTSSFGSLAWNNNALSFTIIKGSNTTGLQAMLPLHSGNLTLSSITLNGSSVSYSADTIKGIEYAFFPGNGGSYLATYTADTTPPTVTSTSPSSNATDVSTVTNVTASFNEVIDSTTINTNNFRLLNSSNTIVSATVTYNPSNRTAILTPSSALATSTTYTATISGVKDLAGNALAADYSWSFTTTANQTPQNNDTIPPTITATNPSNNATGVSTSTSVTATFSEAIDATTINTINFELRNSSNVVIPAAVTYNPNNLTATLTPNSALANSTTYTARVRGGTTGVKDSAGNTLVSDYTWSFTTIAPDITPPTVTSTTPSKNASGVRTSTTVTVTFSEAIDAATINTTNFELRNLLNLVVPATVTYNPNNFTATLTPSSTLAIFATYTARVRGGTTGVKDLAGNPVTSNYTWTFTTGKK